MQRSVLWLTVALAAAGGPAAAQDWTGTFTLSGWFPTISGDERAGDLPGVGISGDPLASSPAFVATGAIRRSRLGLLVDAAHADLGADGRAASPDREAVATDTRLRYASGAASWRFHDLAGTYAEAYGGLRAFAVDLHLQPQDRRQASSRASGRWVDPIVGMRGLVPLADALSFSGLFDVGGFDVGGSDLTYQVYGGLNYGFSERFLLTLGYRHMSIDYQDAELDVDVDIEGPVIGLTWLF